MKSVYKLVVLLSVIIGTWGCTKSFKPTVTTVDYNYLVVEGTVNMRPDSTLIKLSRSVRLPEGANSRPETNATVTIEDALNNKFVLSERTKGNYFASALNLDPAASYRLRIKTADGKTYLSDFVPVKVCPAIDSVGFLVKDNSLDIYCNTHDPLNSTHYYRWDFQETWEYSPPFTSTFISDGTQLVPRNPNQFISSCWRGQAPYSIITGTSIQLSQDVIFRKVVNSIPYNSEKLGVEYSILVRQYPLTKNAYEFWQNLKTNTENLGSIFDAQPSVLKGNIHNAADPDEPVIGFLSVGSIQSRRLFIFKSSLPAEWIAAKQVPVGCQVDTAYLSNPITTSNDVFNTLIRLPTSFVALGIVYDYGDMTKAPIPIGYERVQEDCTNCMINGGTSKQPSFWK